MPISEEARLEMYKKLEEVLGMPHAATLVESLPPGGGDQLATKQDLALLRRDLDVVETRLEAKIDSSKAELVGRMNDLQRNLFLGVLTVQVAFLSIVLAVVQGGG